MERHKLTCTADEWHALKVAVDKVKQPGPDILIRVPLGALLHLMLDHSKLIALHKGEVTE